MALALGIRFPLGEYHATAWDRAANSGDSEWPPSSWRIIRALLSAWHTRCPEVGSAAVERIIGMLASEPPSYLLPQAGRSHTRHYLPAVAHTDVSRATSMTLASRMHVQPDESLVVLWPTVDADASDLAVLTRLVGAVGYLGRAESVCDLRVLGDSELAQVGPVDERWTRPTDDSDDIRVLVPVAGVTRAQLEVTPDGMRKARRLVPEGAGWQGYRRGAEVPRVMHLSRRPRPQPPTTMRWALGGRVGIRVVDGVMATSGLRGAALWMLGRHGLEGTSEAWLLAGPHEEPGVSDRHRHAHWFWLGDGTVAGKVTDVVLWVPDGIPETMLAALVGIRSLSKLAEPPRGYVPAPVHLQGMGQMRDMAPELAMSSTRWTTHTPMLSDRHPKERRDPMTFIERELERELSYRDWGVQGCPGLRSIDVEEHWRKAGRAVGDQGAAPLGRYRRYRLGETMGQRRRGFRVTIELDRSVEGPVSLGALNHFGFGLFRAG